MAYEFNFTHFVLSEIVPNLSESFVRTLSDPPEGLSDGHSPPRQKNVPSEHWALCWKQSVPLYPILNPDHSTDLTSSA
jgi:hypothetical protein